jgi:peptidoglycan hydrolase-like protein with peptidoglycan-binding domain
MVCVLKETLSGLGFYGGQIDDCFDDRTRKAVIAFQQGYGLAVDGIVGPKTWAKIWEIRSDGIPTEVSCQEASACAVVLPPPINIGDGGSPPVTTAPGAKPTLGKDGLYLIGGLLIIIGVLEMFKQGES